jgi:hypothetical protein
MLSEDRELKILQRTRPLLAEVDPEVHLLNVILDSTRQQLAFVMQKGEAPIVVGLNWLDYVSHRDEDLKEILAKSFKERLAVAEARLAREEE